MNPNSAQRKGYANCNLCIGHGASDENQGCYDLVRSTIDLYPHCSECLIDIMSETADNEFTELLPPVS
ncbi:hypothetical protein SAMN05216564_10657 [Halopenitus persicus]|uniref:Uncharacterized protein n=1 Tax=Halopenitus persicus TaxID=1048396 RepID=A0A1H3KKU8_9EURY|nr:hypothetical protein SAMN05216564_10657 [Halopenitus persicus]